jgi:hypothetical protein
MHAMRCDPPTAAAAADDDDDRYSCSVKTA